MKVGKSTFAYPLVISIARGSAFLDRQTKRGGVLILALEEHPRDVENRLKRLGIREDDPIYVHEGLLPNNEKALEAVRAFILDKEITLVLVDSLSVFWNVKDENDNAAIVREVKPLLALARDTEAAVGLIHHDSKSGGPGGRNIRGGSALFGLVDQAIMLEHLPGEITNKRLLKTLGRYAESPSELVIELVGNEYRVVGTREEVGQRAEMYKVREALTVKPMDIETIAKEADIKQKAARRACKALWDEGRGEIIREGGGKKNDPHTYRLPDPPDSFRSHPLSIGKETNFELSGDEQENWEEVPNGPS